MHRLVVMQVLPLVELRVFYPHDPHQLIELVLLTIEMHFDLIRSTLGHIGQGLHQDFVKLISLYKFGAVFETFIVDRLKNCQIPSE